MENADIMPRDSEMKDSAERQWLTSGELIS